MRAEALLIHHLELCHECRSCVSAPSPSRSGDLEEFMRDALKCVLFPLLNYFFTSFKSPCRTRGSFLFFLFSVSASKHHCRVTKSRLLPTPIAFSSCRWEWVVLCHPSAFSYLGRVCVSAGYSVLFKSPIPCTFKGTWNLNSCEMLISFTLISGSRCITHHPPTLYLPASFPSLK